MYAAARLEWYVGEVGSALTAAQFDHRLVVVPKYSRLSPSGWGKFYLLSIPG
jgi:hypothetical protein